MAKAKLPTLTRLLVASVVHSNTVENVFSVFKRGMTGVFHFCGEAHLHRYLAEFDFRYNNCSALGVEDTKRAAKAVKGAEGKRLMYGQPRAVDHAWAEGKAISLLSPSIKWLKAKEKTIFPLRSILIRIH